MESRDVIFEARAQILWGEPSSSVRFFLISNGLTPVEADAKLKEFAVERTKEVRGLAIKSVIIGLALIVLSGTAIWATFSAHAAFSLTSTTAKGDAAAVIAGCYGVWRLIGGIFDFVSPKANQRSVSGMDE